MIALVIRPLVDLIFAVVEGLISLRVILKLFGAYSGAPFVRWVYETTTPLLQPFAGMFPSPKLEGSFVIEFSALFALVIYATVGYLIRAMVEELARLDKKTRS